MGCVYAAHPSFMKGEAMDLIFDVSDQIIKRNEENKSLQLVSGTYGIWNAAFHIEGEAWAGLKIIAYFSNFKSGLKKEELDAENRCLIPYETIAYDKLNVSLIGYDGTVKKMTTNVITIDLIPGGSDKAERPNGPSPDIYVRLIEDIKLKGDKLEYSDSVLKLMSGETELARVTIAGGPGGYMLPTMSELIKGGAKVGNNLEIVDETLHVVGVVTSETDPTVPSWAKQTTKPTYNKVEVGLGNVDNTSDVNKPISTAMQSALNGKVNNSLVGSVNGVAQLDANGLVPSSQLPSFVDDILEGYLYNNAFYIEATHTTVMPSENGKIYVNLHDNTQYRWSGTSYTQISKSLVNGETTGTAFDGAKGKQIREDLTAHVGIGGSAHALATETEAGFIAPEEKTKLQGIAENANNYSLTNQLLSAVLSGATEEVIVDADTVPFTDVSGANATKKITWANIKATLKFYFDGLYMAVTGGDVVADAVSLSIELVKHPRVKKTATLTTCTSLTVTLPSGYNWFDEFVLYFTTGVTPPTPVWPVSDSNWIGGKPTLAANKTYVVSFQNGIGVVGSV